MEEKDTMQIIAKNIVRIRKKKKLSQEQLAFEAKINRTYMGYIENAKYNITIGMLEKVAKALNCSLVDLITEKE